MHDGQVQRRSASAADRATRPRSLRDRVFRSFGSHTDQCSYGGSTAHQAPELVPSLARLFSRPPSSVLAKTANLDGSRSHGAVRCPGWGPAAR